MLKMIEAGQRVPTRDGRMATVIAIVPEACADDRIVALVGTEIVTYYEDGAFMRGRLSNFDLMLEE